jgi:hypothetical protein
MAYDAQVLLPTLIGSILSCIASVLVLISYIIYADQQRSFRHALVLNLALAGKTLLDTQELTFAVEFINSLNNSISGIHVLVHRSMITPGAACSVNGWVGQWSVQVSESTAFLEA